MKFIIDYAGKTYVSVDIDEATATEVAETFYNDLERANKLKIDLKDGGYLLLGSNAIKSCAIIILDTE